MFSKFIVVAAAATALVALPATSHAGSSCQSTWSKATSKIQTFFVPVAKLVCHQLNTDNVDAANQCIADVEAFADKAEEIHAEWNRGDLDSFLVDGWQVKASEKTGNPMYVRPSVLVIYRKDHAFLLDDVIPKPGQVGGNYDLVVASQPWRARMSAEFKAKKVLGPLVRALGPAGRLLAVQSSGDDPALEMVHEVWPDEQPFKVNRHELIKALRVLQTKRVEQPKRKHGNIPL